MPITETVRKILFGKFNNEEKVVGKLKIVQL
jgi:hypothetical protein